MYILHAGFVVGVLIFPLPALAPHEPESDPGFTTHDSGAGARAGDHELRRDDTPSFDKKPVTRQRDKDTVVERRDALLAIEKSRNVMNAAMKKTEEVSCMCCAK